MHVAHAYDDHTVLLACTTRQDVRGWIVPRAKTEAPISTDSPQSSQSSSLSPFPCSVTPISHKRAPFFFAEINASKVESLGALRRTYTPRTSRELLSIEKRLSLARRRHCPSARGRRGAKVRGSPSDCSVGCSPQHAPYTTDGHLAYVR